MADWQQLSTPEDAVDALIALHDDSASRLRADFATYADQRQRDAIAGNRYPYARLRVVYKPDGASAAVSSAFGKFDSAGIYENDIARPKVFACYLTEQLSLLHDRYGDAIEIWVGPSKDDIPYPYVLEGPAGIDAETLPPSELAHVFPTPDLAITNDDIADGKTITPSDMLGRNFRPQALSLFSGLRTDYSLQRLKHYSGTDPEDFQQFILFTNYHRYMDEFVDIGLAKLRADPTYKEFIAPGGVRVTADMENAKEIIQASPWRRHQMPAYHLTSENGHGITLVNIGVGPSNAKTITDHLAVLRPQCWIMVGHCGGLRHSQRLGDYVLAHAYLRRDQVLDSVLPSDIPVPPIAEVQLALTEAAATVTGDGPKELKTRLRTGTVVTHADRNWELRFEEEARLLDLARAVAIDMESATVAANGYRFRVPYGTLLCVSDKPLHGEIKLPGAANRFYERAIGEHMKIGIEALEIFRRDGASSLHSRKLRSFDEPPFR